jgi:glutamyl/glutaminyl-tRNA synthetase
MQQTIRSRIAPTPSGYLHIGNAFNFILTWLIVRKNKGTLRLRIDDLDVIRVDKNYLDDIFYTLDWLGLDWDEGPHSVQEHYTFFSQQNRIEHYRKALRKLEEQGDLFACECSRKQLEKISPHGQYPQTCLNKHLSLHTPETSLRIITPEKGTIYFHDNFKGDQQINLYDEMRDFIVKRRDDIPAYQIASLTDDLDYQINTIIRGSDLLPSTAAQLFLAEKLNRNEFREVHFYHHPIWKDEAGNKLSKSAGSISIKNWREEGKKASAFYEHILDFIKPGIKASSCNELLEIVTEQDLLKINLA